MIRLVLGFALLVSFFLLFSDPQVASAQKGGNAGTIKKVDAKNGIVTIRRATLPKKSKEDAEKEFLLNDDAKVTIVDGGQKKTMTGKEALAAGLIKEGAAVSYVPDGDLKLKELTIGGGGGKN
ncbi:MAG: hypothetical protein K8T89_17745 [Planctomycetes bacterium]|nr:hypothetical protein [Planctomycetota bacterium]